MKNSLKLFAFFLLNIMMNYSFGQERDMQTWLTAEIKIPVFDKIEFGFENEMRFINNTSLFGRNQAEFELYYVPESNWSFGLGYRLKTVFPFSEYTQYEHRWLVDALWKTRVNRIRINTRIRLQNDQESFLSEPVSGLVHREKIRIAYKIRKTPFLLYAGVESYFRINNNNPFELRKIRSFAGTRIDISTQSRISLDLILDKEYNRKRPISSYILQIGYSIDLGRRKDG